MSEDVHVSGLGSAVSAYLCPQGIELYGAENVVYETRCDREAAFEAIITNLMMAKIDETPIGLPGLADLVNIYRQAENANGDSHE